MCEGYVQLAVGGYWCPPPTTPSSESALGLTGLRKVHNYFPLLPFLAAPRNSFVVGEVSNDTPIKLVRWAGIILPSRRVRLVVVAPLVSTVDT